MTAARTASDRIAAAFGIALLFGPVAIIGMGMRARPLENRELRPWPGWSDGWNSFAALDGALVDRLPVREAAIRTDAWLDESVFGDEPTFGQSADPRVLRGRGDYLFLAGDLENACVGGVGPEKAATDWWRLMATIEGSGRPTVLIVAPDKSTILRHAVPSSARYLECADDHRTALWSGLRSAGIHGWVDVRGLFERVLDDDHGGPPVYFRSDTHWTPYGSAMAAREILLKLDPERWSGTRLSVRGSVAWRADLSRLRGGDHVELVDDYALRHDDAAPARRVGVRGGVEVWRSKVKEGPKRVLFVHDSFGEMQAPILAPFFREMRALDWHHVGTALFRAEIAAADVVIIETAEREAYFRPAYIATETELDTLQSDLTGG